MKKTIEVLRKGRAGDFLQISNVYKQTARGESSAFDGGKKSLIKPCKIRNKRNNNKQRHGEKEERRGIYTDLSLKSCKRRKKN